MHHAGIVILMIDAKTAKLLPANIRLIRERNSFTQEELGKRAGIARNTVARIERGETNPTWPIVVALAAALGVSVAEFSKS